MVEWSPYLLFPKELGDSEEFNGRFYMPSLYSWGVSREAK